MKNVHTREMDRLRMMETFRDQLIGLLDELIEQFPHESDLIIARIFIKDQAPVYDIFGRFIRDVLPLKKNVDTRDASFFLETDLFTTKYNVAGDNVTNLRKLWLSPSLDDTDREAIWSWMDVLMSIGQRYYDTYGYVVGWHPPAVAS